MSKRSIEETYNEDSNSESKYDDSENQLSKKIKLENQKILDKIKEMEEDTDISEHEVHNFYFILLLKQLILINRKRKLTVL